jgi:D-lactate dehydrogenase
VKILLCVAGFNNVDLIAAKSWYTEFVVSYSPEAVAEHAMAMILTLNRKHIKPIIEYGNKFSLNGFGF